jgi:hypothetical protein
MQEQAEGVGQEAVTAQAVGGETVLELLDAVELGREVVFRADAAFAKPETYSR